MPSFGTRNLLRRIRPLDRIALGITALFLIVWIARILGYSLRFAGFIEFCFFLSLGYLAYRGIGWARIRLLWGLRNRLIVAYIFIALVPVVMLIAIGAIAARIVYSQLAGYLLVQDVEHRIGVLADAADSVASAVSAVPASSSAALPPGIQTHLADIAAEVPGLEVNPHSQGRFLARRAASVAPGQVSANRFAGLVQDEGRLWVLAEVRQGSTTVRVRAPVTAQVLENVAPYLGPIQLVLTHPATAEDPPSSILTTIGGTQYAAGKRISTSARKLQPAVSIFDVDITGVSTLDAQLAQSGEVISAPIFASYSARPSQLNHRFFASLGDLSSYYFELLIAIILVFFVLEVAALATGIVMTRTITRSVANLYEATQFVKSGDFSHRIRVERADQLGALADSFNAMAESVNTLIQEQRARQRLEHEISIAHEVQSQLFPQQLPHVPGIELAAANKPARGVSGDYYDFLTLGPTRLGFALGDISGKGISAALLMASAQAALRSLVLLDGGTAQSTAQVVSGINRHLFLSTAADRFATFFFATYDSATQVFQYTNAGHPPALLVAGDKVQKLDVGGMIIGAFDGVHYDEATIHVEPGSIFVAYSDGLVEPENVYGEEFGTQRLAEVAVRHRHASAQGIVDALLTAAEEWAGTAEQADDMTVIVARLGAVR
jgi:phosphoserine phosphatase RsbU/P